jgi:transposase
MAKVVQDLPENIDALKQLVSAKEQMLLDKDQRIAVLEEQLRLLMHKRFGASSEKASLDQLGLFNEAEATASPLSETSAADDTETTVPEHKRKKPGRRPLSADLPRVVIEHDLPEDQKVCRCGCRKKRMGQETSEQLDIIPPKAQVLQHVRYKYACLDCEGTEDDGPTVTIAPMPPQPIPKSNASPRLLAYIVIAKFLDGLPLYRLEKIFARFGVDLGRGTMAGWMIRMGDMIVPLINLMNETQLGFDILQMDETTVQVLKEPGRAATSKSYMWVRRGGPPDQPVILFDYDPSRSGAVPFRLLGDFKGTLQTDGYEGYAATAARDDIVHVGCLAHARRKFDEAVKAQAKTGRGGMAKQGLELIQKIYRVEREARDRELDCHARKQLRDEKAKPIWDELRKWLDRSIGQVPPQTLTGKALGYLDKQWPRLVRYLDDGRVEVDNNLAENAIRPFVLGRKAWLFSDTPAGANASARLYSLIETAKANGLEPYAYLRHVFTELPKATTLAEIEALLPWNVELARSLDDATLSVAA